MDPVNGPCKAAENDLGLDQGWGQEPSSNKPTIAGVVARGPGKATIYAWLGYGPPSMQASCVVRVLPVSIDTMSISPDSVMVPLGG